MLIGFFVPYAFISAELGTQYPSEGGMYTWIKKAFGKKWAGRVAWFYWVNYPLWIASLADLVTSLLMQMLGMDIRPLVDSGKQDPLGAPILKPLGMNIIIQIVMITAAAPRPTPTCQSFAVLSARNPAPP